MKTSEETKDIATALYNLQGLIENARKDTKAYNYYYADLAQILDLIKVQMHANGLCVIQDTYSTDTGVAVTTRLQHCSGQWIETSALSMPLAKKDAQSAGSAITYARRYQLCAMLGIASIDDDGEKAVKSAPADKPQSFPQESGATDAEAIAFAEEWKDRYSSEEIKAFIAHKCSHTKMSVRMALKMYMKAPEGFQKEIDSWVAQKDGVGQSEVD